MIIKITKNEIIKALYTERLQGGRYVNYDDYDGTLPKNKVPCPVCAVGAIISNAMPTHKTKSVAWVAGELTYDSVFSGDSDKLIYKDYQEKVLRHLEHREYLSALSTYFEGGIVENYNARGFATTAFRTKLADFVAAHFPETLTLNTEKQY